MWTDATVGSYGLKSTAPLRYKSKKTGFVGYLWDGAACTSTHYLKVSLKALATGGLHQFPVRHYNKRF